MTQGTPSLPLSPKGQRGADPRNGGHRPKERHLQAPYAVPFNTVRLLVRWEICGCRGGLRTRPVGGRSWVVLLIKLMPGGVVSVASVDILFSLITDSSRYPVNRTSFATFVDHLHGRPQKVVQILDPTARSSQSLVSGSSRQVTHTRTTSRC